MWHPTQTRLAFAFLASKSDDTRWRAYNTLDQAVTLAEIDVLLAEQVKPDSRWLMSSETLACLTEPEMVQLLAFLGKFFDNVSVIVYFRR